MRVRWSRVVLAVVVALSLAGTAAAIPVWVADDPAEHSWSNGLWQETNPYWGTTFDMMQFTLLFPQQTYFEQPIGITSLNHSWTQDFSIPTITSASGGAVTQEYFSNIFIGSPPHTSFDMLFTAWLNNAEVDRAIMRYDGSGLQGNSHWTVIGLTPIVEIPAVPEPISMVMLGCLGAGMIGARKLKGKK